MLLSSNFEGFPNVLLEALVLHKPIISTDCHSGPRELLAPNSDFNSQNNQTLEQVDYGVLVPIKNESLLAKAMLQQIELGKNKVDPMIVDNYISQFDVSVMITQWLSFVQ